MVTEALPRSRFSRTVFGARKERAEKLAGAVFGLMSAAGGGPPAGSDHYRVLFLTGVLLFSITFVVNLTADLVIRGVRRK